MVFLGRRIMTTAEEKNIQKVKNWLKTVGIDPSKSDDLIAKYGIDNTVNLVKEALMAPHPMAKHLDGKPRSSKSTINYILENDLSAEAISTITKKNLQKVTANMPQTTSVSQTETPEASVTTDNTTEHTKIHAELINQAEASINTSSYEEKKTSLTSAIDQRIDYKIKLRTSATENNTPTTSSINEEKHISDAIKSELGNTNISSNLTEEEQKEALLQEYTALRKERYEALCYQSGLDMYISSKAITDKYGPKAVNAHLWNGCDKIGYDVVPPDSIARVTPCLITDKSTRNSLHSMHGASCAITGATIVYNVCQEMDFKDNATFTPPSELGFQYRSAAGHFSSMDSETSGYRGRGKMKDLILKGKIGPGDRISTPSKTESGYHLRTVIAVNRDDKGEITGYVVQGNNKLELSYHDINDTKDSFNNRIVTYSSTSQWASDQINAEIAQMRDLSIEEIQELIETQKKKTTPIIIDVIKNKEDKLIQLNNDDFRIYGQKYPIQNSSNPAYYADENVNQETTTPANDIQATRQELKYELAAMTGSEVISAETYFKNRDFEKRLDAQREIKYAENTTSPKHNNNSYVNTNAWLDREMT